MHGFGQGGLAIEALLMPDRFWKSFGAAPGLFFVSLNGRRLLVKVSFGFKPTTRGVKFLGVGEKIHIYFFVLLVFGGAGLVILWFIQVYVSLFE